MKKYLILCIVIVSMFQVMSFGQEGEIEVFYNGESINFDTPPQVVEGRTLVPISTIAKAFGFENSWDKANETVTVKLEDKTLVFTMSSEYYDVTTNDSQYAVYLDVSPQIINGRTMLPLKVLSGEFKKGVTWDNVKKTISIIDVEIPDVTEIRLNGGAYGETLTYSIKDGHLNVAGKVLDPRYFLAKLVYTNYQKDPVSNESFSTDIVNGNYNFNVALYYLGNKISLNIMQLYKIADNTCSGISLIGYCDGILIEDNALVLPPELMRRYERRYIELFVDKNIDKKEFLVLPTDIESKKVIEFSRSLVKDNMSNLDKALIIHDWVSNNIYYNKAFSKRLTNDYVYEAVDVFNDKRALCDGYAFLTELMLRSVGIPARTCYGSALNSQSNFAEHLWNEAFIDNRWVIIDTTWDSNNKYDYDESTGAFVYEHTFEADHHYFDVPLFYFSLSHLYEFVGWQEWMGQAN